MSKTMNKGAAEENKGEPRGDIAAPGWGTDRPMAARGLISYRARNHFGWTMIGAKDHEDAYRQALRSDDKTKRETLEVWDGDLQKYVSC